MRESIHSVDKFYLWMMKQAVIGFDDIETLRTINKKVVSVFQSLPVWDYSIKVIYTQNGFFVLEYGRTDYFYCIVTKYGVFYCGTYDGLTNYCMPIMDHLVISDKYKMCTVHEDGSVETHFKESYRDIL